MLCYAGLLILTVAAPARNQPTGFVIDFAPGKWTADSEIRVQFEAADGTKFDHTFRINDASVSPNFMRALVAAQAREDGWEVKDDGKNGMIIRAYKGNDTPSPVSSCRVRVSDAAAADQPTVKTARE